MTHECRVIPFSEIEKETWVASSADWELDHTVCEALRILWVEEKFTTYAEKKKAAGDAKAAVRELLNRAHERQTRLDAISDAQELPLEELRADRMRRLKAFLTS